LSRDCHNGQASGPLQLHLAKLADLNDLKTLLRGAPFQS
jgi:hypothetical protein